MAGSTHRGKPLLVEILTEELPPKALQKLGDAFADGIRSTLDKHQLLGGGCVSTHYATPRRLAVHLDNVLAQAPDQAFTEKLMPVKIGVAADGGASPALTKKLAAKGLSHLAVADLTTQSDGKQDYLYATGTTTGSTLAVGLQEALDYAIAHLPIPKFMRYQLDDGHTSVKFVRPAHSLMALHGSDVVAIEALGLKSANTTLGHRFMSAGPITVTSADSYEAQLRDEGKVVASFAGRRRLIAEQLRQLAEARQASLGDDPEVPALLDEVTALVEHPTVYAGQFEARFLQVPQECLILTMRLNQKYFPLFDPATGKLTNHFLIVSNMRVDDPANIIEGNERVIRPRLTDAQFFFDTDRKTPLADRVESLGNSVYHNKLGSQLERVRRVRRIARYVAGQIGADAEHADRAALLAKADLNSNMVGEFPELQGIMGAYYAQAEGEPDDVVTAIRCQYQNRFESPVDASTLTSAALFIAERAETLIGIWGIGLVPTGERDPFGLRRAALGLISAFEQLRAGHILNDTDGARLALPDLLAFAFGTFGDHGLNADTVGDVRAFVYERYRNQLAADYDRHVIDAVLAIAPPLHQVPARIQACVDFAARPEAASLAAANKRIGNLLKKSGDTPPALDPGLLREPAEKALADIIATLRPTAQAQFAEGDFMASLATMAGAKDAVDAFFGDIMVMADDPAIRANRLALLAGLHDVMNQVADLSRLAQ
jgi:glycyl-tRNA synthetase beta chain